MNVSVVSQATINVYGTYYAKAGKKPHNLQSQFEMDVYPKANEVSGRMHFTDTLKCYSHLHHDSPGKSEAIQHESHLM